MPETARAAVELLKQEFEPYSEYINLEEVTAVLHKVVRLYGGDPSDSRQRLDNLMKYGKNELG